MRAVFTICFFVLGNLAAAQGAEVRSGAHDGFDRLVFTLEPGANWQLGRNEYGYVLRVPGAGDFRLGSVFDRIGDQRISSLSSLAENEISIALNCDCHADAFLWRPDKLVVDIIDGPPNTDAEFESALALPEPPVSTHAQPAILPIVVKPERPALPLAVPDKGAVTGETGEGLRQLGLALTESVSRAASQGLLETALIPEREAITTVEHDETENHDRAALVAEYPSTETLNSEIGEIWSGLQTQTSIDRERADDATRPGEISPTDICPPEDWFDVTRWGDTRSFSQQIGAARAAVSAEFDKVPEAETIKLARTLIFFGFGKEAQRALEVDGVSSREREFLADIARLVDLEPVNSNRFSAYAHCPGGALLWALLAEPQLISPEIDARAIRTIFRELPESLKGHIGAHLAAIFADAGDPDTGRLILEQTGSATTIAPEATLDAEASIVGSELGETARLATYLERLGTTRSPDPETLLTYLELAHRSETHAPEDVMTLITELRFEFRNQPIERELAAAEIVARIDRGEFIRARDELLSVYPQLDQNTKDLLLTALAEGVADRADDLSLLRLIVGIDWSDAPAETRNRLAERTLNAGFSDHASALISDEADSFDAFEGRILRARIALRQGHPDEALSIMSELAGPEVAGLRAEAMRRSRDFTGALTEIQEAEAHNDLLELAWLAEDFGAVAAVAPEPLGPLVQRMTAAVPATAAGPTLAQTEDILARASQSHADITALLDVFPAPATGSP